MARRRPADDPSRLATQLSRRERQIMDVVYHLGRATVAEIAERLPDSPTATAVRMLLRILEQKGYLLHHLDGLRHVYRPVVPAKQATRSVLHHVVETLFRGSRSEAMTTLLELPTPLERGAGQAQRADRARSQAALSSWTRATRSRAAGWSRRWRNWPPSSSRCRAMCW